MINRQTVFVLGAGASKPYGFPLGIELVDQICLEILDDAKPELREKNPRVDYELKQRLLNLGFKRDEEVEDLAISMRGTQPYSIDSHLEKQTRYLNVGKAAIADVLLRAEAHARAARPNIDSEVDWYRYLLN